MFKEWIFANKIYCESAYTFNDDKKTVVKMTDGSNPIEVGKAFLDEAEQLQRGLPYFTRRYFVVITAKVVANLGLGRIIRKGFGIEDELNNNQVEHLIDNGFDENMAVSLVHTALHFRNKIEGNGTSDHLDLARKKLESSNASTEIKSFPRFIIETFEMDKG